jgi:hypothetical protein
MLACSKCKQIKPETAFRVRPDRPRGRGRWSACRDCERAYATSEHGRKLSQQRTRKNIQKLRETNIAALRRRERDGNLKRLYGISATDYDKLLTLQHGVCAICKQQPQNGRGGKLHLDHDHTTGKIRGLLCHGCNIGIGNFKENPYVLANAIQYVQGYAMSAAFDQIAEAAGVTSEALRSQFDAVIAKAEVRGTGVIYPPAFTPECFAAIKQRADAITDQVIKTDLFRLILEVERLQQELADA